VVGLSLLVVHSYRFFNGVTMILELKTLTRAVLRRVGIIPFLHGIRMLWHSSDYEDKFAAALLGSVRVEDCVWDVGANIGFYTEKLSKLARQVVAFEPVSENFVQIKSRCLPNVDCRQIALGDVEVELLISRRGQFSSIAAHSTLARETAYEMVSVKPGDALVDLPRPNVVKIDVEGYEPEVIRGMSGTLRTVRAVYIEVHFSILASRGMMQQPATIVRELKRLGFTTVKWVDASHIEAQRAA
jgi:FkbM family methyltransferase